MVFFQNCFHLEQHCFHLDRQFSCSPNISNLLSRVPTKSSLVIQNSCSSDYPVLYHPSCTSVLFQFSSLTIIYLIFGFRSGSLTFLVQITSNCRPPSHQSILCILHFSPFLTNYIILSMFLVCLVSLPFLAIHIADLLSKTI